MGVNWVFPLPGQSTVLHHGKCKNSLSLSLSYYLSAYCLQSNLLFINAIQCLLLSHQRTASPFVTSATAVYVLHWLAKRVHPLFFLQLLPGYHARVLAPRHWGRGARWFECFPILKNKCTRHSKYGVHLKVKFMFAVVWCSTCCGADHSYQCLLLLLCSIPTHMNLWYLHRSLSTLSL